MKDWLDDLRGHVTRREKQLKKQGRAWWPRFVYHYTNVSNAINILNTGVLYSRAGAQARGLMVNENANPEIIAGTNQEHLDFVRLYFSTENAHSVRQRGHQATGGESERTLPSASFLCFRLGRSCRAG